MKFKMLLLIKQPSCVCVCIHVCVRIPMKICNVGLWEIAHSHLHHRHILTLSAHVCVYSKYVKNSSSCFLRLVCKSKIDVKGTQKKNKKTDPLLEKKALVLYIVTKPFISSFIFNRHYLNCQNNWVFWQGQVVGLNTSTSKSLLGGRGERSRESMERGNL